MPPTLHHPILKEIYEELLKKRVFKSQHNNFLMIQPLILAGKECLAAFVELLRKVRSVTMFSSHISLELQNCVLSSEKFPLGLWKKMALYTSHLIVSDFDEDYQMSMIKMMENSTSKIIRLFQNEHQCAELRRIEASFDLNTKAWRHLLNTSVTEISAPIRSLIDIGKLDEHLYANIGIVETFTYIDDSTLFEELLVNFRIPCKYLKIQNVESWTSFWDVFSNNLERVKFSTLEKLVLKFRVKEQLPNFANFELPNCLEALQNVFPNLKELDMKIKFDDNEEYQFFGDNFVPNFSFLQHAVNELTNQIRQAVIYYKVSFHYCRTEYIDWPHDDVAGMEDAFNRADFVKVDESNVGQKWVHENEISESKDLKITFYLDELEVNSELYNDMMDDLEIGNFYNYGDGDYSDEDAYDDAGIDFDN